MTEEYGDLDILRLFDKREAHEKYRGFIVREAVLQETWLLLEAIDLYYLNHPGTPELDWTTFRARFLVTHAAKLGSTSDQSVATFPPGTGCSTDLLIEECDATFRRCRFPGG